MDVSTSTFGALRHRSEGRMGRRIPFVARCRRLKAAIDALQSGCGSRCVGHRFPYLLRPDKWLPSAFANLNSGFRSLNLNDRNPSNVTRLRSPSSDGFGDRAGHSADVWHPNSVHTGRIASKSPRASPSAVGKIPRLPSRHGRETPRRKSNSKPIFTGSGPREAV